MPQSPVRWAGPGRPVSRVWR